MQTTTGGVVMWQCYASLVWRHNKVKCEYVQLGTYIEGCKAAISGILTLPMSTASLL